jgi:4-amino-4-deoxy-L-arabinose transferase-like glycosyltransferase
MDATTAALGGGRSRILLALPVLLSAAVYVPTAAQRAVLDVDEALYIRAAQEMLDRGDFVTPFVDGVRFLDKPPLLYWLLALGFRLFGPSELVAHLPPALAVIATTALVVRLARRGGGVGAALTAGLVFPLCVGTYLFTRETLHDSLLVLFLTLAMDALLSLSLDPRRRLGPMLTFSAAVAGAALSKGLVGILFPLAIAALFFWTSRERPSLRVSHLVWGGLLFAALALPWHLLAARANPGFFHHYIWNEQILRFLGRREPKDYSSIPLPLFLALVPVWLFPWSAFLPALASVFRLLPPDDGKARAAARLAFLWAGVVLVFLCLSARLEHYAFPLLPPLAVLVGIALASRPGVAHERTWTDVGFGFRALAVLGLALAVAAGVFLAKAGRLEPGPGAAQSRTSASDTDFGPLSELPPPLVARLLVPAAVTVAALALLPVAAWWLERRGRRVAALLSVAASMVVFAAMAHLSLDLCEPIVSSKAFGLAVARRGRPGDHFVVHGDFETANSALFYEPLPLEVVDGAAPTLLAGLASPGAPRRLLSRAELRALWAGVGRTFLIVSPAHLPELGIAPVIRVTESGDRLLVSNR